MAWFNLTVQLSDFAANSLWFNIKLLTNYNKLGNNNECLIADQAYASTMKHAYRSLGITSKHFVEFGRGTDVVACEMQEVDLQHIKTIGSWNLDVREDRFVIKPPLKAMQALAWYSQERGVFFLPWSTINPPPELHCQVFPFLDKAIKTIKACNEQKPTAQALFELFLNVQCVILQDTTILLREGRKNLLFFCLFSQQTCSKLIKRYSLTRLWSKLKQEWEGGGYLNQAKYGYCPSGGLRPTSQHSFKSL